MGILADVQRDATACVAVCTLVFWIAAGAGIAALAANAFYWGAAIGFCIAFYAIMAESTLAFALSIPGLLVGVVFLMFTAAS